MWSLRSNQISDGVLRYYLESDSHPVTVGDVLILLQNDTSFRTFLNTALAAIPFDAFRWETPPISSATQGQSFEYVAINSPDLMRTADPKAFAEHFNDRMSEQLAASFSNLGKDATMIVPKSAGPDTAYVHLASFVRSAPRVQRDAFWALVGKVVAGRISTSPLWLSTAGAGVAWLHVRIDTRPKYYGYAPYRQPVPNRR